MKAILSMLFVTGSLLFATASNAQTTAAAKTGTDSTNLTDYAGSYTFATGSPVQKFTVSVDKGELYGEADTYGKNKLIKQAKADTYQSTSSYGSLITFVRDATTKAITSLTLAAQGTELPAKKDQ